MMYFLCSKIRSHSNNAILAILEKLWDVCKKTPQSSAIQIIFQLLTGRFPESAAKKQPCRPPCSSFYRFFQGAKIDNKAEQLFQKKHYSDAALLDEKLLFSGYVSPQLLFRYAKAAFRHFQFLQAFYFCELIHASFPHWHPGKILLFQGQCAQLCARPMDALTLYTKAMLHYKIPAIINEPGYEASLQKQLYGYQWKTFIALTQANDSRFSHLRRGQAFLLGGAYKKAEEYLVNLPFWYHLNPRYHFLLARSYIATGQKKKAEAILMRLIRRKKSYSPAYNEALRLACLSGDTDLGVKIQELAKKYAISLSPSSEWILLCHMKKLKEAFIKHSQASYFNILSSYIGDKLLYSLPKESDGVKTLLVLSECFPGDEIKYSLLYPLIQKKSHAENIIFSCNPKGYYLFQRTFPQIKFLATHRTQSLAMLTDYSNFTDLPDPECCRYIDNRGWKAIQKADGVISVMHALADVLQDYDQLTTLPHLLPDPQKRADISSRLQIFHSQKLVGLSWRSMQRNLSREWANFQIEELSPLLEMEGIQFIDCQYDGCTTQEQRWLDTYFPGKLLTLEGINQKDDIDSTAALYACLDVIVTVPTYTCELSGSVGTPTLIFAASHIPEAFMTPDSGHHAFLGSNTRFVCKFAKKSDVIQLVKKTLQSMLS